MVNASEIKAKLPYTAPFLFVGELLHVDENGVKGIYTFSPDLDFYRGHFAEFPVTPGVILTETMAQIGVVCLGIYLEKAEARASIAMTSSEVNFLKPVFPGETVTVISEKLYFRFGKLKCKVSMWNESGEEVCNGTIAGMITKP